jgi:hypothetical protein
MKSPFPNDLSFLSPALSHKKQALLNKNKNHDIIVNEFSQKKDEHKSSIIDLDDTFDIELNKYAPVT